LNAQFSFDGKPVAYLLHSQEFSLNIAVNSCWFLLIRYHSGQGRKWTIRRPTCHFKSIANAYSPNITIWGIGWGINKLLHKKLNINILKTIEQNLIVKNPTFRVKTDSPRNTGPLSIKKVILLIKNTAACFLIPAASGTKTNHTIQIKVDKL
jgi:hypothetical protein